MELYRKNNVPFDCVGKGLDDIPEPWRQHLTTEVGGNNFLRGGQSLLLIGEGAEQQIGLWSSALTIGGFNVYQTNIWELERRAMDLRVLWDCEDRAKDFEEAEVYLIHAFFKKTPRTDQVDREVLTWAIDQALRDGRIVVIASDNPKADMDVHGPFLGNIIQNKFEALKNGKASKKKPINKTR
jgi:hypothetical protein